MAQQRDRRTLSNPKPRDPGKYNNLVTMDNLENEDTAKNKSKNSIHFS